MASVQTIRPSDARRQALRDADSLGVAGVPLVSNFFPIERYYDAARKVLESFHRAYNDRRLDDAYVYGRRFGTFSMDALPQHHYYKSPKYSKERNRNNEQMTDVIQKMEQIAAWMDVEEEAKARERKRLEAERRRIEAERQRLEYEKLQRRMKQLQTTKSTTRQNNGSVQQSALDKLKLLEPPAPPLPAPPQTNMNGGPKPPSTSGDPYLDDLQRSFKREGGRSSGPNGTENHEDYVRRKTRPSSLDNLSVDSGSTGTDLPPPMMPPPMMPPPPSQQGQTTITSGGFPPPPSYSQVMEAKSANKHTTNGFPPSTAEQALGHKSRPAATSFDSGPTYANRHREQERREAQKRKKSEKIPFRRLRDKYVSDYKKLRADNRIEVFGVNTHQGRLHSSTNGCAVISPLVVSHHLRSSGSVTDGEIVDVIDRECAPLLREIRGKLGLSGAALIIPSDVHDHLVDKKVLSQKSFIGATGGNIMDKAHTGEFLKLLVHGENKTHTGKKTGAALFFREHVVSIVKVPAGGGKFYYDLIDSLPGTMGGGRMMATRTRCRDISAFEALLRWYAANKFSDSNMTWIDRNEWDDTMADFDPRVFQAFVWGSA